jgi:hypothetical protein
LEGGLPVIFSITASLAKETPQKSKIENLCQAQQSPANKFQNIR